MSVDFRVVETRSVTSRAELRDALTGAGAVRLAGRGTTQDRVPPPASRDVVLVELAKLDRLLRLEPGDLTCSVEPGMTREALDAELAACGTCLPCEPDGTTIGGSFARGARAPLGPAGHSPRTLLLGFEGVRADGTAFKAGAKVVKSVAGFDLPKLFVGSRGRLFCVTALHLKLRPLPPHSEWFAERSLDRDGAVDRFWTLRRLRTPPAALVLRRDDDGAYEVLGRFEGRAGVVEQQLRASGLTPSEPRAGWRIDARPGGELLTGYCKPRNLPTLLSALPESAPMTFTGGCQFDVALTPAESDTLWSTLSSGETTAETERGAPERRGRATTPDPASEELTASLRTALDPEGRLQ